MCVCAEQLNKPVIFLSFKYWIELMSTQMCVIKMTKRWSCKGIRINKYSSTKKVVLLLNKPNSQVKGRTTVAPLSN